MKGISVELDHLTSVLIPDRMMRSSNVREVYILSEFCTVCMRGMDTIHY